MQKKLRNEGKSYISSSGKIVPCRAIRDLQPCRNKCKDKITPEQQQEVHELYWQLGSYQLRQAFAAGLIEIHTPKTVRIDKSVTNPRNRTNTYKYYLEISGQRVLVCQKCFKGTLCESDQFFKTVVKKKIEGHGAFLYGDLRGKHRNPRKLPPAKEREVIDFINSFPAYESHYTRRDTSRRYLPGDLSVAELYRLYCENHGHSISVSKFSQIFQTLNLKFKKPKLDTCHKCDKFKTKIAVTQVESLDALKSEQADHHHQAEQSYESKRHDKQKANIDVNLKVFCFDLQQCLPTPFLRSSVSFYKRPLWTFNLTVHDCSTNEPFCYMWHEALAKRGGNEIASCLFQHLQSLQPSVNHVVFYSDCCPGQNKNSFVATMFVIFMHLETTGSISIIDHKFMVPGHTHMECDSDHALIERKKKKHQYKFTTLVTGINLLGLLE